MSQLETLLKKYNLSVTDGRKKILQLFLDANAALEHATIEQNAPTLDRVTIYRTLQSFVEKGIIHTIPTADSSIKYALCKDECGHGHHHDNHVHFLCNTCGTTFCIDQVTIPKIKLPAGFVSKQADLVVSGRCNLCNQN